MEWIGGRRPKAEMLVEASLRAMAYSVRGLNPEGLATIDVEIMKGNMR